MGFLHAWWVSLWQLIVESGLWLIVGFAMAGAMHAIVPRGFLERHLSGKGPWPILKASLLGIPLPLCSCSVIPVASGLRRGGAGRGASAAFAISTPQTGEESIPITWALFGPIYALTRPVVAIVTAFLAGMLIERFGQPVEQPAAEPEPAPGGCGCSDTSNQSEKSCCSSEPKQGGSCGCHASEQTCGCSDQQGSCCSEHAEPALPSVWERIRSGFRHGFVTMPIDLAPWLAIGLALAAAVTAAVPEGWIESHIGTGLLPMVAMLAVGIPLYICATSSTPLAYSLVLAGLSPGAALVLLLAGPATNVATLTWAIKDLGLRATAIYLAVISGVAIAAGWVFDAFLASWVHLAETGTTHEHGSVSVVYGLGAVLFAALLGWSLTMRIARALAPKERACCAHA